MTHPAQPPQELPEKQAPIETQEEKAPEAEAPSSNTESNAGEEAPEPPGFQAIEGADFKRFLGCGG
jgi:hypothetical protein